MFSTVSSTSDGFPILFGSPEPPKQDIKWLYSTFICSKTCVLLQRQCLRCLFTSRAEMKGEFFISYGAGGGSRASHKRDDDARVAPHLLLYFHPSLSLTRRKSHRDAWVHTMPHPVMRIQGCQVELVSKQSQDLKRLLDAPRQKMRFHRGETLKRLAMARGSPTEPREIHNFLHSEQKRQGNQSSGLPPSLSSKETTLLTPVISCFPAINITDDGPNSVLLSTCSKLHPPTSQFAILDGATAPSQPSPEV